MVGDSETDSQSAKAKIPFILIEEWIYRKKINEIPHDI